MPTTDLQGKILSAFFQNDPRITESELMRVHQAGLYKAVVDVMVLDRIERPSPN